MLAGNLAHSEDYFLGDRLRIYQPKAGYRAGIDAVLLAATVAPVLEPFRILDVGSGVGVAGLCLAARIERASVVLVEKQPELAALAERNVSANDLESRVNVVCANIFEPLPEPAMRKLIPDSFAHVIANPPFHDERRGTPAATELKTAAHAMPEQALDEWVRFMARMAAPGGYGSMIHKAQALPQVLRAFEGRFGALKVKPICPRVGDAAIRIIVSGKKGSRAPLSLLSALTLHGDGHAFSPAVDDILRRGVALDL